MHISMTGCNFYVHGSECAVDSFLVHASGWPPHKLYRVDNSHGDDPVAPSGFFTVPIGDPLDTNYGAQIGAAHAFLDRHRADLTHLATLPGIDDRLLVFQFFQRQGSAGRSAHCRFPAELVAAAGGLAIGLEMRFHPRLPPAPAA